MISDFFRIFAIQWKKLKVTLKKESEVYSFNITSLFVDQLNEEQQALFKKQIEQAFVAGGEFVLERGLNYEYPNEISDNLPF